MPLMFGDHLVPVLQPHLYTARMIIETRQTYNPTQYCHNLSAQLTRLRHPIRTIPAMTNGRAESSEKLEQALKLCESGTIPVGTAQRLVDRLDQVNSNYCLIVGELAKLTCRV